LPIVLPAFIWGLWLTGVADDVYPGSPYYALFNVVSYYVVSGLYGAVPYLIVIVPAYLALRKRGNSVKLASQLLWLVPSIIVGLVTLVAFLFVPSTDLKGRMEVAFFYFFFSVLFAYGHAVAIAIARWMFKRWGWIKPHLLPVAAG